MPSQQIPPFTPEALQLLFHPDTFRAFQKPGFPSHYWAPLLAVGCGASRNEVFFLSPDDLLHQEDVWLLRLRRLGSEEAPTRRVPLHPWLIALGFVDFVHERRQTQPHQRLFQEYKAGRDNAGVVFSRAFVQWIKNTIQGLAPQEQGLFAEDFHFPSLRALFWQLVEQAGLSSPTLELLQGGEGDLRQAAAEVATLRLEVCFPPLPPYPDLCERSLL